MMRMILLIVAVVLNGSACFAENLALGRPYTFSHPPNYSYCTDTGDATDLTDGIRYDPGGTSLWTQKSSVGWASGDQSKSIEIDLGRICSINGLTFESAADARTQGTFPLAVMVFLSDDSKTYSCAGNIINEAVSQKQYIVHIFKLEGLKEQARFVRLQTIRGGHYVLVDEIEVLGSKTEGLTPKVRDLRPDAIAQFANDRVPLTRQNNSSLTLLGHAQSRLAEQLADHGAAVKQAQAALKGLRSEIISRSEAETVDYRHGVPFTELDRKICKEMGTYQAATGHSGLQIKSANPWAPLLPFDWDASETASEPMPLLRNEWGELAFNLTNPTAAPMELSVMDFSKMDEYMDLLPETRLWILWTGFEWDHREMYPREGDVRRKKVFTQWLKEVIAHMKEKGYGYDDFAFLWIDEPSQENMHKIVKPSSELLRQIDPQAQVWLDISSDNTEASLTEFEGLIDIWCPAGGKLGWDFWQGKRTWFYDSASDKGKSPTGHYRYKLWTAFEQGCTGNGFWTYTDSSDLWDDYAGTPTYSVVYDGPDGVISSKRWEAYRAGVEDYELCKMLRDAIVAAKAAGKGNTAEIKAARESLDKWVEQVLNNRNDPRVAEQAHQSLLQHLVILSANG